MFLSSMDREDVQLLVLGEKKYTQSKKKQWLYADVKLLESDECSLMCTETAQVFVCTQIWDCLFVFTSVQLLSFPLLHQIMDKKGRKKQHFP